jgi:hypothetical protein
MAGYAAGGDIVGRADVESDPDLGAIAIRAQNDEFQIVADLDDTPAFIDATEDGGYRVACLGDSNTFPNFFEVPLTYCLDLPTKVWHPTFTTGNFSQLGAQIANAGPTHGPAQLQAAIADGDFDAAIFAFGTNDLAQGQKTPAQTLAAYVEQAAVAEANDIQAFIALTPPIYNPNSQATPAEIAELNASIQSTFSSDRVIDFHSGFFAEIHYAGDGVHMIGPGHELRSQRAFEKLVTGFAS